MKSKTWIVKMEDGRTLEVLAPSKKLVKSVLCDYNEISQFDCIKSISLKRKNNSKTA
jgi:hypothetical protein